MNGRAIIAPSTFVDGLAALRRWWRKGVAGQGLGEKPGLLGSAKVPVSRVDARRGRRGPGTSRPPRLRPRASVPVTPGLRLLAASRCRLVLAVESLLDKGCCGRWTRGPQVRALGTRRPFGTGAGLRRARLAHALVTLQFPCSSAACSGASAATPSTPGSALASNSCSIGRTSAA